MTRLSGITPSGETHLGNYLGAMRRWAAEAGPDDLYFVSNLHAMTVQHDPNTLRESTRQMLAVLIATRVPVESVFVQSDLVSEHMALTWLLECTCSYGEAHRMIQFKEKGAGQESVRLSLLTYPVLMAADILLHGTDEVPVGLDQGQHVELARAVAKRFNNTYGEAFVVPRGVVQTVAAKVRDLGDPAKKMSKSSVDGTGVIYVLDRPELVRRKFRRAVTDGLGSVAYDPQRQPGVANLLEILAVCTGEGPEEAAEGIDSYRVLKDTVADAVVEQLRPVRERAIELLADDAELDRVRAAGADRARERSQARLDRALRLAGL